MFVKKLSSNIYVDIAQGFQFSVKAFEFFDKTQSKVITLFKVTQSNPCGFHAISKGYNTKAEAISKLEPILTKAGYTISNDRD